MDPQPAHGLYLDGLKDFWQRVDYGQKLVNSILISGSVAIGAANVVVERVRDRHRPHQGPHLGPRLLRTGEHAAAGGAGLPDLLPEQASGPLRHPAQRDHRVHRRPGGLRDALPVLRPRAVPARDHRAARIDGANKWQVLWRIVVPVSRPTIGVLLVFFFIWTWNEFLLPLVMLISNDNQTVSVALGVLQGQRLMDATMTNAAALLACSPRSSFSRLPADTDPRHRRGRGQVRGVGVKFTDGYWLLREGVTAAHPVEVLDVSASDGTLDIHAPTQPIRHRGDLLKGPVVTISAHAPMPDVIGVTLHALPGRGTARPPLRAAQACPGVRGPPEEHSTPTVEYDDEHATLTAGALSVRVARTTPWHVDFLAHGRVLTTSGPKGMGIMRTRPAPTICASS